MTVMQVQLNLYFVIIHFTTIRRIEHVFENYFFFFKNSYRRRVFFTSLYVIICLNLELNDIYYFFSLTKYACISNNMRSGLRIISYSHIWSVILFGKEDNAVDSPTKISIRNIRIRYVNKYRFGRVHELI